MDEGLERLGIDPVELRRRNLLRHGERRGAGARPHGCRPGGRSRDRRARAVAARSRAAGERARHACRRPMPGAEPMSLGDRAPPVRRLGDGDSAAAPRWARDRRPCWPRSPPRELGVELEHVHLVQSDTAAASYDRSTGASRTTTIMGLAVQRAAAERAAASGGSGRRRGPTSRSTNGAGSRSGRDSCPGMRSSGTGSAGSARWSAWATSGARVATEQMPLFWEVGCLGVEVDGRSRYGHRQRRQDRVPGRRRSGDPPPDGRGPGHRRGDHGHGRGAPRGAPLRGRLTRQRQPVRLPVPADHGSPRCRLVPGRARRRDRAVRRQGRR